MRRSTSALAAMLAVVLLAGCQPGTAPTPTSPSASSVSPVPTPTYQCTPEAGGEATPCTQIHYEEMKAKDRLYAEAEAVYRRMFEENIRVSRAGGVSEPTPVIKETADGAFLEDLMDDFMQMVDEGLSARGDDPELVVKRAPGVSKQGSIVALSVCVDATGWSFYAGNKKVLPGRVGQDIVYFSRLGDALKIIGADGEFVDSCDS